MRGHPRMKKRLAASGYLRLDNNSAYIKEGEFHSPETVFKAVTNAQKVKDGIIEIMGPKFGGRLGVRNNGIITDAVVEETGETGTAAVCRLLLMPHGIYSFRPATPADRLNYAQEVDLPFEEAQKFLAGPSSIGLAFPGRNTLHNLKALTGENQLTDPEYSGDGLEDEEYISAETVSEFEDRDDFKALVENVSRKQRQTMEIREKEIQTQTNIQALKTPGPLPKRKEERSEASRPLIIAGVLLFLGVVGGATIIDLSYNPHKAENTASVVKEHVETATTTVTKKEPPPSQGTAPFSLPAQSARQAPPPTLSAGDRQKREDAAAIDPVEEIAPNATAAPVSRQLGNDEVSKWSEAVRRKPGDPTARRELAQAYLLGGDTTKSIEQFYELMKMKRVKSEEIISYANNLMVFGNDELAKQFLRNILRSDPQRTAIRQRLSELR